MISFLITLVLSQSQHQPKPWPKQFFAIISRNTTNVITGKKFPWEANHKWYDYDFLATKNECSVKGWTVTNLMIGKEVWNYNVGTQECVYSTIPVPIVRPDWMVGGDYIGREIINGAECDCWNKEDHIYCEDILSQKTKRVFTPFVPVSLTKNQEDYATFIEGEFDRSIFQIPSYCKNETDINNNRRKGDAPIYCWELEIPIE